MKTTLEQLSNWLNTPRENENLEFKEAQNQFDTEKAYRYCVAIANEGGGKLILGVEDKYPRKVTGTRAFFDHVGLQSKILNKFRMRVVVEEFQHEDGRVLIFHIPSRPGRTAYQFEGAYLMRSGEETVPMTEDRLRQIFDEGKPEWLMWPASEDNSADDVVRLLDTQSYFDLLGLPYPENRQGVIDRLESEKVIIGKGAGYLVTNLGAVLFAKKLTDFEGLARKAPRVIVYFGRDKLRTKLDRLVVSGYAVGFKGLIDLVNAQIPTNEVIEDALRSEVKMFPQIAVRELVANALIHQDFNESGMGVTVELYDDRLEISSPGKPHIKPERFIDEYQSRNEKLADLMRRLGICEEKGSGIDKVVHSAEIFQLPPPDFRVGEKHTLAVLFAHTELGLMDRTARVRACYQHCCLRYVTNQKMTNQSLRERFKLPDEKSETVSRIIRDAIQDGFIRLDDPSSTSKRYAKYVPFWT